MNSELMTTDMPSSTSWRSFWGHFAQMVVVMFASMAVLGVIVSLVFSVLGHGNLLHYAGLRGFLMTSYMVVGMAAWMRVRRHPWSTVREMSAAMILPYALLIGPYAGGVISAATFLTVMHVLMLPFMLVAMLYRRQEYSQHSGHAMT